MILIVDDVKANIVALKKILEIHNLEVDTATSGEEALKKILKTEYSLIIMDVQMPHMDGFEVAEILAGNSKTKDIPVIFLSAVNTQKNFISKGYETGGVEYITKPVDPDLLILKVKTFLKLYNQQQELKIVRDLLSKEIEIRKKDQENLEVIVAERTKELVKNNEELELRNHELQQFSWVVSHDLKEPARKIQMFINVIKDKFLIKEEKSLYYIDRTLRTAERMQNLITDLLEYSRLSSNFAPMSVDLDLIVADVFDDFDYLMDKKKVVVKIGDLPVIQGIPSQLRQVFQNLIGNSIKFSKTDVTPIIEIKAAIISEKSFDSPEDSNGKFCRIEVKDNGIGFDENYLGQIFLIFQSLNDRSVYEGTGIGLAIAKKIIDKHNGLITAKSGTNMGATFIIVLPLEVEGNL
ncbi:hybrid sensor histidine kinase/response regulator [Flavobacterium sp.]|uniref:hybrid sensor histidine kinase/response regulator n=1 Tax=Flavobacterium sp. TaxID=239 RepID=UPI003C4352E9